MNNVQKDKLRLADRKERLKLEEEHVEKEESFLGQFLTGATILGISLLLIVGIFIGLAYLFNP